MSMKQLIFDSTIMGGTTLAMGFALTKVFETAEYEAPNAVFWFLMGFNADLLIGIIKMMMTSSPPPSAFGELETVDSIDDKIRIYQQNISGLKKIIRVGSPAGQVAAREKLNKVYSDLAIWEKKRSELVA